MPRETTRTGVLCRNRLCSRGLDTRDYMPEYFSGQACSRGLARVPRKHRAPGLSRRPGRERCASLLNLRKIRRIAGKQTCRMTEPTRTCGIGPADCIRSQIKYDVIRTVCVFGNGIRSSQVIQAEEIPHAPRDEMIRTRRVAAQSDCADEFLLRRIEGEAATEHVHATDLLAHERVISRSEVG